MESPGSIITSQNQLTGVKLSEDYDITALLLNHGELTIHQHLDVCEVCLCLERNNRYSVYDQHGNQILYTYEGAQCFNRQCYGSLRPLKLITTDNEDKRMMLMERPLRCSSRMCCICCNLQELTVKLSSDEIIGIITEKWSCSTPLYEIEDVDGKLMFSLQGSTCHCRCCCEINFEAKGIGGNLKASIHNKHGGCKGVIGASNEYTIEFEEGLSGKEKAVIFGSTFLLDFNYFGRHGKCY